MYKIDVLPKAIFFGKLTENRVYVEEFDVSAWQEQWPDGQYYIRIVRPGETKDKAFYTGTASVDENVLTWIVRDSDIGVCAGVGEFEVICKVPGDDTPKKISKTVQIRVDEPVALDASDVPPAAAQGWIDQAIAVREDTIEASKHYPYINEENSHWMVWDIASGQFVDTGVSASVSSDHRNLENRDAENQHPIAAITGLRDELDNKQDVIGDLESIREGAELGATALQSESDPTVPSWAKQLTKPVYTAEEVGALPADTPIPEPYDDTAVKQRLSAIEGKESGWDAKQDAIDDLDDIRDGAELGATAIQTETDPTVPNWAKQPTKPTYTAEEVGALPDDTSIPEIDSTLTTAGKAADAKATGDALSALSSEKVNDVQINGTSIVDAYKVANVPVADNSNYGAVKFNPNWGVAQNAGRPVIYSASEADIAARSSPYYPIVPSHLNYAVKSALSDANRINDMTDAEKKNACEVIGAETKIWTTIATLQADEDGVNVLSCTIPDGIDELEIEVIDYYANSADSAQLCVGAWQDSASFSWARMNMSCLKSINSLYTSGLIRAYKKEGYIDIVSTYANGSAGNNSDGNGARFSIATSTANKVNGNKLFLFKGNFEATFLARNKFIVRGR